MMKKWILAVALSVGAATSVLAPDAFAAGAPSVNDVEATIARGDMQGAQRMLDQVLAAHPNSAHAHYLDAQVLEHLQRFSDAQAQLNAARTADPSISFTDRGRFETVERRINAEVAHVGSGNNGNSAANRNTTTNASVMGSAGAGAAVHHGPSAGMWILLLIVIVGVIALVMWGMRKRQREDDQGAGEMKRDQLQRATQLMDALRAAKLDLKLSASPDKQSWLADAEAIEAQLRTLIDSLSAGGNTNRFASNRPEADPGYQLEALEPEVERIKALAAGRPDPRLSAGANPSPYAAEADRLSRPNEYPGYPGYPPGPGNPGYGQPPPPGWQPQQQPVIVQQPGIGSGVGGLMTGVLLGEMLGGNRERDVIVEHDSNNAPRPDNNNGNAGNGGNAGSAGNNPFDFGNGGDDWGNGGGTQIDAGNDDDSWDDNS